MDNDTKFYYMGIQHGISDQCNKYTSMVDNINLIPNHPCKRVYPAKYLEGYSVGYADAKDKSWYIVNVAGGKISTYYAEGEWVSDKTLATKFPTRAALEKVIKKVPNFRSGKCGMSLE